MFKKDRYFKKIFINLFVFFFAFVFVLVVAEIFCRFFYQDTKIYHNAAIMDYYPRKDVGGFKYFDKETGVIRNSKNDQLSVKDYTFNFNLNMVEKIKPENIFRVAVIGDSFSTNGGVEDYQDSYVSLIRKKVKKIETLKKNVQFLVFSHPGINTKQEHTIFEEAVLGYNPDLIILQYCDNDTEPIREPFGKNKDVYIQSKTKVFIFNKELMASALPVLSNEANRKILKHSKFARFVSSKLNKIARKKSIDADNSFKYLDKIIKKSRQKNISMIVMNFSPSHNNLCDSSINNENFGPKLHKRLKKFFERNKVPFYNMCDYVDDIRTIESINENDHYNKEGHKIVADVLFKAILEELPKEKNKSDDKKNGIDVELD